MIYLDWFKFPDDEMEFDYFIDPSNMNVKRGCYDTYYPFKVLSAHRFERIDFEPITILYGGNGSGKSTALNVIAEKAKLNRDSAFNKSSFYSDYVDLCEMNPEAEPELESKSSQPRSKIPEHSRIITSDDVFDYMLNIRSLNEGIDVRREELFQEYLDVKYSRFQLKSIADFDQLKRVNQSRSKTQSKFVRSELIDNVREYSNGESAFQYFTEKIEENGLYLLDEPENSLSPKRQMELASFIEDSMRFFECQFVISTHSP